MVAASLDRELGPALVARAQARLGFVEGAIRKDSKATRSKSFPRKGSPTSSSASTWG
jgi:hypothetical protein